MDLVFPYFELYSKIKTPLYRSEIYNSYKDSDFRNNLHCFAYISDENSSCEELDGLTWKQIRLNVISCFVISCQREGALSDLKAALMRLLETTDIHDTKLAAKLLFSISQMKTFGENESLDDRALKKWKDIIYYYFYFAVTDKLHSDMAFSLYPELERDLEEYNQQVTMLYGASGNPGMYQLYALSNKKKPNIIALYECGELEYYGKGSSGKVNYEKAYEYYEATKECNNEHPLATWSIAYMRFHYDQELAKEHREYRVRQLEDELKNGKTNSWFDTILYNAETAYDNGCAAAANLLGKIINSPNEVFPISRRGKFKNRKAIDLFKESADAGYVFGCNNYAQACLNNANSTENKDKKRNLYREALKYLEKSALLGNPWAANKMGLYYMKGLDICGENIVEKNIELAFERFNYATVMINTESYYWPLINLCENFWFNTSSDYYRKIDIQEISELLTNALKNLSDREHEQREKIEGLIVRIREGRTFLEEQECIKYQI